MATKNDSKPDALLLCKEWMNDMLGKSEEDFAQIPAGSVRNVMATTMQQVLNALGGGESEQLKHFASDVRNAVYANKALMDNVDALPGQQFLAIKVLGILDVVEVYLNQPNASSGMGALIGKKAEGRRNVFMYMAKEDRKFTRVEMEGPVNQDKSTINGNLNSLLALGLVRAENLDGRTLLYELTWHGRNLAKNIAKNGLFEDETSVIKELKSQLREKQEALKSAQGKIAKLESMEKARRKASSDVHFEKVTKFRGSAMQIVLDANGVTPATYINRISHAKTVEDKKRSELAFAGLNPEE